LARSAVRKEHDLRARVVANLKSRPWLHDNNAAWRQVVSLGRLAEEHREDSFDYAEDLFLKRLPMATTAGSGRISPEVCL
jgi:hypothetical protein